MTWGPDGCLFCPGVTFATRTSSTGTFDLRFDLANDQYAVHVSGRDRFAVPGAGLELFHGYRSQTTYVAADDLAAAEFRFELVPTGMVEYRLSRPLVDGERVTVSATGDRYGATGAYFTPGGPNPRLSLSAAGTSPVSVYITRPDETLDVRADTVHVEHRGHTIYTVEMD